MKIGFEIHQQLDTHKLFCRSPSLLRDEEAEFKVIRRLRTSQSELGEVDEAARKEFLKGKSFVYQGHNDSICLVELDEEPPRGPNPEAVEIALTIALMLNASVVDEIHFMRKLVIDGSNTSGFQRTAIIAFDGHLDTEEGRIRIPTICLEEEAARKVGEDEHTTTYNLDRLGIPLVEITTAPDIKSPEQARDAALKIGELLRATEKVKRGIGTIRQDINVSIEGGARVEIKGVQELNTIPGIIENEVERQKGLIEIKNKLAELGVKKGDIKSRIYDVTDLFKDTQSKVIKGQLKSGRVLAVRLPGFRGLLGGGLLGREMAGYVKVQTGLRGIFHSDELPAYGIIEEEVDRVKGALELGENDAFVLVAGSDRKTRRALEVVLERAQAALSGVPEETRMARDGRSDYMRPLPGAARMYPETDIPPFVVSEELLSQLQANLPETYEDKAERLVASYGLGREQAGQIVRKGYTQLFEGIAHTVKTLPLITAASIVLDSSKYLEARWITPDEFVRIVIAVDRGKISKEAVPDILDLIRKGKSIDDAITEKSKGDIDLEGVVDKIIAEKSDFIKERGHHAMKPLMGLVMKEARGKVDGRVVNEVVKRKLEGFLSK